VEWNKTQRRKETAEKDEEVKQIEHHQQTTVKMAGDSRFLRL
jgi:hypothetical protein